MERPRVIIVGGMDMNIPDELRKRFEIVKHLEQQTNRVDRLPEADYIFVISDFVSHTIVDVVKHKARLPIVYLTRGWSHMKTELERRSILPPDSPEAAEEPARQPDQKQKEAPGATGLSNDDLWELYGKELKQAVTQTLKPRELIAEEDLLDILSDLIGIPKEELRNLKVDGDPFLEKFHMWGLIDMPKEKVWCLMMGDDGFACGKDMPEEKISGRKATRRHRPAGEGEERALKMSGLRMGPYLTAAELAREMMKYEEFHLEGRPLSTQSLRKIIQRATELKIVDDTHEKLYVDHKDNVVLKRVEAAVPEELEPVDQPPLSEEGKLEKQLEESRPLRPADITKGQAEQYWRVVVDRIRGSKPQITAILGNSRIEWLAGNGILVCLVPQQYSIYMRQLDSTENWGLISSVVRETFGISVVVRFVQDNSVTKGKS